jgi:hypothetical protein
MPSQVSCPSCDLTLRIKDELIGKRVKCPQCAVTFLASQDRSDNLGISSVPQAKSEPASRMETEQLDKVRSLGIPNRGRMILTLGISSIVCTSLDILATIPGIFAFGAATCCCGAFTGGLSAAAVGIVWSVLSLVLSGGAVGTGLPGWMMGHRDLAEIRAGKMDGEGQGQITTGWIMSMIGTMVGGLGLLCGVLELIGAILGFSLTGLCCLGGAASGGAGGGR